MSRTKLLLGASCATLLTAGIALHARAQVQAQAPAIAALTIIEEPPLPTGQNYSTETSRAAEVKRLRANMPQAQEIAALEEHALPRSAADRDRTIHTQHFRGDPNEGGGGQMPANLTADYVERDADAMTYTAIGHVEIIQAQKILRADKVIYDVAADTATAIGNVVISEPNGDIYFAKRARMSRDMTVGIASDLDSYLGTGAHFHAVTSVKRGQVTTMQQAIYTPCECDEGKNTGWNVNAQQMIYDRDAHMIHTKDTTFDVFGVPVLWTPYARFPDGEVKQESGFLAPTIGYKSSLGAIVSENYYWAIAPDKDAELGTMVTTSTAPVALLDYRQRFDEGELSFNGSSTYSDHIDDNEGEAVNKGDQWRGHLFANGVYDINDLWRVGADVQLTSDDQYLRQYEISHEDVLENDIYAERFDDRDYAKVEAMGFQDTRVSSERTDQPDVLPQGTINLVGDPNAFFGGRWNFDGSILGLERFSDKQDMDRISTDVGWQRRLVSDFGLVSTADIGARTDGYFVQNRDTTGLPESTPDNGFVGRVTSHVELESSYPIVKPLESAQILVEPIVSLSAVPTNHENNPLIPNEDSQDVELDASNLFDYNRFPGLDRVEDGVHTSYGAHTGIYGYGGSYGDVFLGQSYRLTSNDNDFPTGSGLSNHASDIVGQITLGAAAEYGAYYRVLLSSQNLSAERHEITLFTDLDRFRLESRYTYNSSLEGTVLDEAREQTENDIAYSFSDKWRVRLGAINDLGQDSGLRRAVAGIDYFGCCLSVSINAERNVATVTSGENGTSVTMQIGLKGLGGFQTPQMSDAADDGLWRDSREIPKY